MKLIIDIGNTLVKTAIFDGDKIVELVTSENGLDETLEKVTAEYSDITSGIVSSVRHYDDSIIGTLLPGVTMIRLSHKTPLPFKNNYLTPETLGRDRIAAAAAAVHLFPGENVLVIDAGTCITYDIVTSDREYLGGAISPGLKMRFDAMHTFTGKLPLVNPDVLSDIELVGKSTRESLLSGGQLGILLEVTGMIEAFKVKFGNLKTVIGGGDYNYFDKYLKNNIFAAPNLVLTGLKKILDFNEEF